MAKNCLFGFSILTLGIWMLPFVLLILQPQQCECRYLPTRSHVDDLDKLRELMLQILESSKEDLRSTNEVYGNNLQHRSLWLNSLSPVDIPRNYGVRTGYDSGRY